MSASVMPYLSLMRGRLRTSAISEIMGSEMKKKFIDLKQKTASRSPADLGTKVKNSEVIYHHEVYNQMLWNDF